MDKNLYVNNCDAAKYVGASDSTFFHWVDTGMLAIPYRRRKSFGNSHENSTRGKLFRVRDLDIVKEKIKAAESQGFKFNPRGLVFGENAANVTHTPIDLQPEPMTDVKPVPFPNQSKVDPIDINKMIKADIIAQDVLEILLKEGGIGQSKLKKDARKWIEEYVKDSYIFKRSVMDILIESLRNDIPTINEAEKATGIKAIRIFLIIQTFAMCLMACAVAFGGK